MVTVVCLKWGDKYAPEYVNKLYNMVQRNLTIPHRFVCVTENTEGLNPDIEIMPLKLDGWPTTMRNFQGWWFKLDLFRSNNGLTGKIFYVDLDTVIVGNIDQIVESAQEFTVLRDFYRGYPKNRPMNNCMGSGLMCWQAEKHAYLYDDFMANVGDNIQKYSQGGDQIWIQDRQTHRQYWQDLVPDQIVSYKVHCIKNRRHSLEKSWVPQGARIVCFHGTPRPHAVRNFDWMVEHWA